MKASKALKLYLWAEVAFMAYLVLKPREPGKADALDTATEQLKDALNGKPEIP